MMLSEDIPIENRSEYRLTRHLIIDLLLSAGTRDCIESLQRRLVLPVDDQILKISQSAGRVSSGSIEDNREPNYGKLTDLR